jgi:hypothetical protein
MQMNLHSRAKMASSPVEACHLLEYSVMDGSNVSIALFYLFLLSLFLLVFENSFSLLIKLQ